MMLEQVNTFNGADLIAHIMRSACGYIHSNEETIRGFMAMQVDEKTIASNRARVQSMGDMGVSFDSPTATIILHTPRV